MVYGIKRYTNKSCRDDNKQNALYYVGMHFVNQVYINCVSLVIIQIDTSCMTMCDILSIMQFVYNV